MNRSFLRMTNVVSLRLRSQNRLGIGLLHNRFNNRICAGLFFAIIFKKRNTLSKAKWTLRALMISVLFPQIANQVGWVTAEVGRQPWIVYKLLKTVDGVSKSIVASEVAWSLIMLFLIYMLLLFLFIYLLDRKIKHGPVSETVKTSESSEIYRNPLP